MEQPDKPRHPMGEFLKGFFLIMLCHLACLIFPLLYVGIGLVQLAYVIPLHFAYKKRPNFIKGIWVAAGITFLLNGACYGLLFGNMLQ